MTTMTAADLRALTFVAEGKCERRYTGRGNTMHGAPPVVLHKLASEGYVRDGKSSGVLVVRCKLELTDKGRAALQEAPT